MNVLWGDKAKEVFQAGPVEFPRLVMAKLQKKTFNDVQPTVAQVHHHCPRPWKGI